MSETPPPQFAAYPRSGPSSLYGSADKLQALSDGYFGLNKIFLLNILLAVVSNIVARNDYRALVITIPLMLIVISVLTYPKNKQIAYGKDWQPSMALLASILMGLNSALCCGIIGYVVMQSIASNEMKKYGVKGGLFGIKKPVVEAAIANLRQAQGAQDIPRPIP